MKNILFITPILPYPLSTGGNQAQFHLINYSQEKYNIHFIFQFNSGNTHEKYKALKKELPHVNFHPFSRKGQTDSNKLLVQKVLKRIQEHKFFPKEKPFSRLSLAPSEDISDSFLEFMHDIIRKEKIDLIQVDFVPFLPIVYGLPKSIKKIFIQHEIQYVRNKLTLEQMNRVTIYQQYLLSKMKDDEIAMMNKFDAVVTLTEIDRQKLLGDDIQTKVYASPAAISSHSYNLVKREFKNKIVFIGGATHEPNYGGLHWFLSEVWPDILNNNNYELQLQVIGNWSQKYVNTLKQYNKNVTFLGFVEDLDIVLSEAIMIIPILVGSGMRMKILEASNRGCPFVTTTVGVEGLNFEDENDCFIADKPSEFANKLLQLVNNKDLQAKFSKNAKTTFTDNYSIEKLACIRHSIYTDIIK